jgi:hypothetical protein
MVFRPVPFIPGRTNGRESSRQEQALGTDQERYRLLAIYSDTQEISAQDVAPLPEMFAGNAPKIVQKIHKIVIEITKDKTRNARRLSSLWTPRPREPLDLPCINGVSMQVQGFSTFIFQGYRPSLRKSSPGSVLRTSPCPRKKRRKMSDSLGLTLDFEDSFLSTYLYPTVLDFYSALLTL